MINEELGVRLRSARRRSALALRDVEAQSERELKASIVGAYERGERTISVTRLLRLADLYGVAPADLLEGLQYDELDLTEDDDLDITDELDLAGEEVAGEPVTVGTVGTVGTVTVGAVAGQAVAGEAVGEGIASEGEAASPPERRGARDRETQRSRSFTIDLDRLDELVQLERAARFLVRTFVQEVVRRRRAPTSVQSVSIRADDVRVLSFALGISPGELARLGAGVHAVSPGVSR